MSANLLDIFTAHAGARELAVIESAFRPERRRRARTQVHWPVMLLCDRELNAIETLTQNLSSSGFYCLSSKPLTPGEPLTCVLKIPAYDPTGERTVALECKVQVVRAEAAPDGLFGIACRIEDYHLVTGGTRTV
jgi:PilZ domain-containing protein